MRSGADLERLGALQAGHSGADISWPSHQRQASADPWPSHNWRCYARPNGAGRAARQPALPALKGRSAEERAAEAAARALLQEERRAAEAKRRADEKASGLAGVLRPLLLPSPHPRSAALGLRMLGAARSNSYVCLAVS